MMGEDNKLKRMVKEKILKDWMELFLRDSGSVRDSFISQIDSVLEQQGDIKLSEFRVIVNMLFDELIQEMREQMLSEAQELGVLKID